MKTRSYRVSSGGNVRNAELANGFLKHIGPRSSPRTIKARRNGLQKLVYFSAGNLLKNISSEDLERYRLSLIQEQFSPHSLLQYLTTVRLFFAWLEAESMLFINPAAELVIPKPPRVVRWILSAQQITAVLNVPDVSRPVGLRDRALLEVAYATAVRREELTGISIFDVDLTQATVRVLGKGRRERMLPLGRHGARYLARYLKHARSKLLRNNIDSSALWISLLTARALTDEGIAQVFERIGQQAALRRNLTCHVFRRTCATQMLRNGAHPETVRMLLGHSTMKNLAQYLNITIGDIRSMHKASNPGK